MSRLNTLVRTAGECIRVTTSHPLPSQPNRPNDHPPAVNIINVLRKNIRKEQDLGRCIVVDLDIQRLCLKNVFSPFGVVDKGYRDPKTSGHVILDRSFPVVLANAFTFQNEITTADYVHCNAVANGFLQQAGRFPDDDIKIMLGDVVAAFRNLGIHSHCAHQIAGMIPSENALVIDMSAGFGWKGSPVHYAVASKAIDYVQGRTSNHDYLKGFFNYFWVDGHVCAVTERGASCVDAEQSLRLAMVSVLGPASVNEENCTRRNAHQKVLGLMLDTKAATVSVPPLNITKRRAPFSMPTSRSH